MYIQDQGPPCLVIDTANLRSPCPFAPLTLYYGSLSVPFTPPPGCSGLAWNPDFYSVNAAFQACTIWIGLELSI